jgi:hypothetical protein
MTAWTVLTWALPVLVLTALTLSPTLRPEIGTVLPSASRPASLQFIHHGASGGTPMAAIDWDATMTALASGGLPCSDQRMLKITASLADGIPVDLQDTLTGLDDSNIQLLITAIRRASGKTA